MSISVIAVEVLQELHEQKLVSLNDNNDISVATVKGVLAERNHLTRNGTAPSDATIGYVVMYWKIFSRAA